jgi:hypothetical protein
MTPVIKQVLDAVDAALGTLSGAPTVHVNPDYALSVEDLPAVARFWSGQAVEHLDAGAKLYTVRVDIGLVETSKRADFPEGTPRKEMLRAAEASLIERHAELVRTISRDAGIWALAQDIREAADGGEPQQAQEGATLLMQLTVGFEIDVETADTDPASLPGA